MATTCPVNLRCGKSWTVALPMARRAGALTYPRSIRKQYGRPGRVVDNWHLTRLAYRP